MCCPVRRFWQESLPFEASLATPFRAETVQHFSVIFRNKIEFYVLNFLSDLHENGKQILVPGKREHRSSTTRTTEFMNAKHNTTSMCESMSHWTSKVTFVLRDLTFWYKGTKKHLNILAFCTSKLLLSRVANLTLQDTRLFLGNLTFYWRMNIYTDLNALSATIV